MESNDRSLKVEFNYRFKDPITDLKFLIQQKIIVERQEERVIEEETGRVTGGVIKEEL